MKNISIMPEYILRHQCPLNQKIFLMGIQCSVDERIRLRARVHFMTGVNIASKTLGASPKGTMAWRFKCLLIIGEASIHQPETSDWSSYLDLTILSHLKEGKPLVSDIDDSLQK